MEYRFFIFSSEQKVLKEILSNCGPLSATITCRILNRHMMFFQTNLKTSLFFYVGISFELYPFAEIVNGHKKELFFSSNNE